jgi:diguanylate cyclase (GGDEF)-like protein/PAS domain S-box-containing protein
MGIENFDVRVFEIFKHLPVAFALFDTDMNYITYSNQWVIDYQLNEDEDLTGKNHYEVFPEIPQHWRELHQRCLKGEHLFNKAEKFVRADGSVQYDAWDIRPWYTQDKKIGGMIATTKNVTSEVILSETEKELIKANNFLNNAQKVAKIGHWVLNMSDNTLEWSDQTYRIFEVDKESFEPSYEALLSAIHPDDLEKVTKAFSKSVESKEPYNVEHRIKVNDNRIKYVIENGFTKYNEDGEPVFAQGTVQDVTESKKMQRMTLRYLDIIDKNIIASSTDLDGIITEASQAFSDVSGYTKSELIGQNHNIIRHPDFPKDVYKDLWETIKTNKVWKGELKNRKKDGSHYWVYATISPLYDDNGKKVGYTAIRQNITDKKIIEEISITDGLTCIYNRRHFSEVFPKVINSAKRENELISFIIMDVDHFKQYNDTYGHQMGDDALAKIGRTLKNSLQRADDYCFRLGGEEFGVVFKTDSKQKAFTFAESIRKNIENLKIEHKGNSASPFVTVSMGLVCKNANEIESADKIYKEADDLLYRAKSQGRNQTV